MKADCNIAESPLIPAKAGNQNIEQLAKPAWIPACAGMSGVFGCEDEGHDEPCTAAFYTPVTLGLVPRASNADFGVKVLGTRPRMTIK